MEKLVTIINGVEYPLATTLRVAYMVQGQHNHKAYADVFKNIGDMPVEEQIGIIYCAFKCANKDTVISPQNFLEYYLDNYNLKDLLEQLGRIIKGIMGEDFKEDSGADNAEDNAGH